MPLSPHCPLYHWLQQLILNSPASQRCDVAVPSLGLCCDSQLAALSLLCHYGGDTGRSSLPYSPKEQRSSHSWGRLVQWTNEDRSQQINAFSSGPLPTGLSHMSCSPRPCAAVAYGHYQPLALVSLLPGLPFCLPPAPKDHIPK